MSVGDYQTSGYRGWTCFFFGPGLRLNELLNNQAWIIMDQGVSNPQTNIADWSIWSKLYSNMVWTCLKYRQLLANQWGKWSDIFHRFSVSPTVWSTDNTVGCLPRASQSRNHGPQGTGRNWDRPTFLPAMKVIMYGYAPSLFLLISG
jgi:hypothetical protein